MKYIHLFSAIFILTALGCGKSDLPEESQLTLSSTTLSLAGNAGAKDTISITANGPWTVTANPSGIVTLSPSSGSGNGNVVVTVVQANTSSSPRTVTLTFTSGTSTQQAVLTQFPAGIDANVLLFGFGSDEAIFKTIRTPDSGMLHVGFVYGASVGFPDYKGDYDMLIFKTNDKGEKQWARTLGGESRDIAFSCVYFSNAYYILGYTSSTTGDFSTSKGGDDAILIKMDLNGNPQWMKRFGGTNNDALFELALSSDQKIYAIGRSSSNDGDVPMGVSSKVQDIWMAKFDPNGQLLQSHTYGNMGNDQGFDIEVDASNNIFVTGVLGFTDLNSSPANDFDLSHGDEDAFIMKLNAQGQKLWSKTIGGGGKDQGTSVALTSDGGVMANVQLNSQDVAGTNNLGGADGLVIRYNSTGQMSWQTRIGGSGDDKIEEIISLGNGKYMSSGSSTSNFFDASKPNGNADGWVCLMNDSGGIEWQSSFGGTKDDFIYCVIPSGNNKYYFSGKTQSQDIPGTNFGGGIDDAWYGSFVK